MSSNHRVLFCDLGNVILPFDFQPAMQKIAKLVGKEVDGVSNFFFQPGLQEQYETGKMTSGEFIQFAKKGLGLSISDEELIHIWNDVFTENRPVIEWLRQIENRVAIWGISNTNELHFDYIWQRYPIIRELSGWILSYKVGYRKPSPEIYRAALEQVGVPPQSTIFVDDRPENVEAAGKMGIPSVLFTDLVELIQQLKQRGYPI